jgi:predicted glycogen debranching enzyme
MSYIKLDKSQLVDLEYTLTKELLRSSRSGTYSCTTLNFCNTRKYHGLLVVPQPGIDNERHVLLSSMDETVIQHNTEFNLGVHKYPGTYSPKGHKYIIDFETDPIPRHIYKVGGVHLKKEIIFTSNDDRILIKYTLISANSPTIIRVRPYLAFRNIHALSRANMYADTKYETIENGIKICMYEGYSPLHFQISKPCDYIHSPDWYHDIEYQKELERGYEGHEDLYVPGFFEFPISKKEEIIISVGTEPASPLKLKQMFGREVKRRTPRNTFENCLENSTQQFFVSAEKNKKHIIAGFPWHNIRLRDTFISLPGLTLIHKDYKTFRQVMQTATETMAGPHFSISHSEGIYTDYSADTSLWFIRALQLAVEMQAETAIGIWKNYNNYIKAILFGYRNNESPTVFMREDGLIATRPNETALTWMDATNNGKPVTPRTGMTVEANALWYNAVMFAVTIAKEAKDNDFVKAFRDLHCLIPISFKKVFWDKDRGYLADNAGEFHTDWSVRPNILFAASLPYNPVSEKIRQLVVELVRSKLLTPRGLRTLSPDDPLYQSFYYGNEARRALAYHQGTVWPWLLGAYSEAYLKIYGQSGLYHIEQIYAGFHDTVLEHAIGSISEVYDGDPPHRGAGAISMAWSVAEIRRMKYIIDQYKEDIV